MSNPKTSEDGARPPEPMSRAWLIRELGKAAKLRPEAGSRSDGGAQTERPRPV